MQTIEIDDFMGIDMARTEYPELFHTFKMLLAIDDDKAAQAVSIATSVCPHCWARDLGCNCMRDE